MLRRLLPIFLMITMTSVWASGDAQTLVKSRTYNGSSAKMQARNELGVTLINKPKNIINRTRIQQDYPDLKRPAGFDNWESPISVSTSDGFLMLLHKLQDSNNHQYHCLLFDKQRNLLSDLDLCAIAEQNDCEINDIRYDHQQLFWNFSCTTKNNRLENKCNRLFCYDIASKKILWKSQFLTSCDIFTLDDKYVYSGYGYAGESDDVYLIDRTQGVTLTQCSIASAPKYMELTDEGLFVEDQQENGYLFRVIDGAAIKVTGDVVRLRKGPSSRATIYSENGSKPTYPLRGDVLELLGENGDFHQILFNGKALYISKQYSTTSVIPSYNIADLPSAGVKAWIGSEKSNHVNFEVYDMNHFTSAVELMDNEGNDLKTGTTYKVYIDSPFANGVFLSPCQNLGAVLFIMSDDSRLFAIDMLEATADDGTPLQAIELPIGKFNLHSFATTQKNGITTVWAIDFDGRRKRVEISPLIY